MTPSSLFGAADLQVANVICETFGSLEFVNLLPDSQNSGKGFGQMQISQ